MSLNFGAIFRSAQLLVFLQKVPKLVDFVRHDLQKCLVFQAITRPQPDKMRAILSIPTRSLRGRGGVGDGRRGQEKREIGGQRLTAQTMTSVLACAIRTSAAFWPAMAGTRCASGHPLGEPFGQRSEGLIRAVDYFVLRRRIGDFIEPSAIGLPHRADLGAVALKE